MWLSMKLRCIAFPQQGCRAVSAGLQSWPWMLVIVLSYRAFKPFHPRSAASQHLSDESLLSVIVVNVNVQSLLCQCQALPYYASKLLCVQAALMKLV